MVYSKEDILNCATFESDITSLLCKGDMLVENFCEYINIADTDEVYTEAAAKAFSVIQATIKSVFKTIKDFINKQIEKFDLIINGEKYKKLMSPEMKKVLAAAKDKKAGDYPDLVKAKQQVDKMGNFIETYLSKFNAMFIGMVEDPEKYSKKCRAYIKASSEEFKKMSSELDDILSDKKPVKPLDIINMAKHGVDIKTSISEFKKSIETYESQFEKSLLKLNRNVGTEKSESGSDTSAGSEISDVKSVVNEALTETKSMSKKIVETGTKVMGVISALFTVVTIINTKDIHKDKKESDYYQNEIDKEMSKPAEERKPGHLESDVESFNVVQDHKSKVSDIRVRNSAIAGASALGTVALHNVSKRMK